LGSDSDVGVGVAVSIYFILISNIQIGNGESGSVDCGLWIGNRGLTGCYSNIQIGNWELGMGNWGMRAKNKGIIVRRLSDRHQIGHLTVFYF
jgi:hypothetical protein